MERKQPYSTPLTETVRPLHRGSLMDSVSPGASDNPWSEGDGWGAKESDGSLFDDDNALTLRNLWED